MQPPPADHSTRKQSRNTRVSRLMRYLTSVRRPLMMVNVREVKRIPWLYRALWAVVLGVVVGALVEVARQLNAFEVLEGVTVNTRTRLTAKPDGHDPNIIVVAIDQAALESFSRDRGGKKLKWPWPRDMYLPLLDFCRRGGAKLVIFDLTFSETGDKDELEDNAFAIALGNLPNVIVASEFEDQPRGFLPGEAEFRQRHAVRGQLRLQPPDSTHTALKLPRYMAPVIVYPQLLEGLVSMRDPQHVFHAVVAQLTTRFDPEDTLWLERLKNFRYTGEPLAGVGVVNVRAEPDGTYRRYHVLSAVPTLERDLYAIRQLRGERPQWPVHSATVAVDAVSGVRNHTVYPSMALLAAQMLSRGPNGEWPAIRHDGETLHIGDTLRIPLGEDAGFYLRFPKPTDQKAGIYPTLPFDALWRSAIADFRRDLASTQYRARLMQKAIELVPHHPTVAKAAGLLEQLGAVANELTDVKFATIFNRPDGAAKLALRLEHAAAQLETASPTFAAGSLTAELEFVRTQLTQFVSALPLDFSVWLAQGLAASNRPPDKLDPTTRLAIIEAFQAALRECNLVVARQIREAVREFNRVFEPLWQQYLALETAFTADVNAALSDSLTPQTASTEWSAFIAEARKLQAAHVATLGSMVPPPLNPSIMKDKIVFIAGTAPGLKDIRRTPFSDSDPGVMLNATALDNILHGTFLMRQPDIGRAVSVFGLALVGALITLLIPKTLYSVPLMALTAVAFTLLAYAAFAQNYWLEYVAPMAALALSIGGTGIVNYMLIGHDKAMLKGAMGQYMGKDLVRVVERHPERLKLGGEKKDITVLFSDVAGFTNISEALDPTALAELMNRYLSMMTQIILESGGIIDKYIGDAIMALWNAPFDLPDHAVKACHAALDCQAALVRFRDALAAEGLPPMYARIGLNSGPAVVGNMGSNLRFSYTAMGNTVNLSARLEPAAKDYGVGILIGDATYQLAKHKIIARNLDRLQVKGKAEAVPVYEVMARIGELSPIKLAMLERFEAGMAKYYSRDFTGAIVEFEHALKLVPDDGPSKNAIHMCRDMIEHPPPPTWDGRRIRAEKH